MTPTSSLHQTLQEIGQPRVLVVGDLILDRYVSGEVRRISPEAPIPVLAAKTIEHRLGGGGNVAVNLARMGAHVKVLGCVGEDRPGATMRQVFADRGIENSLVVDASKPTIQKSRILSGVQQMLRVDWEDDRDVSGPILEELQEQALLHLEQCDAVVLSDYGKGTLPPVLLQAIIVAARAKNVPVLVDPKGVDYSRYRGATLITPNQREAELALGQELESEESIQWAGDALIDQLQLDNVVITLGARGIYYRLRAEASQTSEPSEGAGSGRIEGTIPAVARAVFDVTGAGDTVVAHLALYLAAGVALPTAVALANHAAGIVVGKLGAHSVSPVELAQAIATPVALAASSSEPGAAVPKQFGLVQAQELVATWRGSGRRVVFTNGCFDVLHAGHVQYLRFAASQGDVLIVGVNSDASIRRLKGPERPIHPLGDRLGVLSALEMVDVVIAFEEDTPLTLIEGLTPDVLVKGEDWADKGVVGREWVESHGGEVVLAPLLEGRSTTSVIESVLVRGHARDQPASPQGDSTP